MDKANKIEALKNTQLNPYLLDDPYDGLSNSLHRWKTVANDAMLSNYDDKQKERVASHYYDKMIRPLYGSEPSQLHMDPIDKSLWMKQAYKEAVNYNIDDAYNNSMIHDLKHGLDSGLASTARVYGMLANALGNTIDDVVALYHNQQAERAKPDAQRQADLRKPWHEQMMSLHNQITSVQHKESVVARGARIQAENHEFWAEAMPTYGGLLSKATGGTAEAAGQFPIFAALSLGMAPLEAVAEGSPLTRSLLKTPLGKKTFGYLMAGTEGLAYGVATRPEGDKGQAWRDALNFTVFHGVMDVVGLGLKKLIDLAPEKWAKKAETLDLGKEGKRRATSEEIYEDHKTEIGNNLIAGGVPAQQSIFLDALHHIHDTEQSGLTRESIKDKELGLMSEDPARWGPVLSSARYIRALLGATGKRLSDIEPGSEDAKYLNSRLNELMTKAGSELSKNVKGLEEVTQTTVPKTLAKPAAKNTLEYYIAKVTAKVAKQGPAIVKMMKPEDIKKMAEQEYAKAVQKVGAKAEDVLGTDPPEKATKIAKRRKDAPALKIRSERTVDKYGQPSARYQATPDYKIRLQQHIKKAKAQGKTLTEFFTDMDDEDFAKDLSAHFYPKALKDAGVYFEHQNTREGVQNPNFLGFMYNYIKGMPKEFGKALEERLTESTKAQKFMSGRRPTEDQLAYYAKAIYNHVDNFLGSGRWPKAHNIFRSTQGDMWNPTQWQHQLLVEKTLEEQKNLKEMFSGDPKAKKAALAAHKILSGDRFALFQKGAKNLKSQEKIADIDTSISDLLTSTGDRERIDF